MHKTASSLAPAAMEGKDAYNRNSAVQEARSALALPQLEQPARLVVLPAPPEPIVIADYDASQGHNSFVPMALAIHALRDRTDPNQAISIVHTDLPSGRGALLWYIDGAEALPHERLRSVRKVGRGLLT